MPQKLLIEKTIGYTAQTPPPVKQKEKLLNNKQVWSMLKIQTALIRLIKCEKL